MNGTGDRHTTHIVQAGKPLENAVKALIMIHGRGGSADNILSLSEYLEADDFALLAPQATNNTWYPFSFIAPPEQNEPWLSSALEVVNETLNKIAAGGIPAESTYFLGFSQGACLALEFVARNARRFGGVIALKGGLIGDRIYAGNYEGDFGGMPVFLSGNDPDPHIPVARLRESADILKRMGAEVTEKVYTNRAHALFGDELELANKLVLHS